MKDRITEHWNGHAEEDNKNMRYVIYLKGKEAAWQKLLIHSLIEKKSGFWTAGPDPK